MRESGNSLAWGANDRFDRTVSVVLGAVAVSGVVSAVCPCEVAIELGDDELCDEELPDDELGDDEPPDDEPPDGELEDEVPDLDPDVVLDWFGVSELVWEVDAGCAMALLRSELEEVPDELSDTGDSTPGIREPGMTVLVAAEEKLIVTMRAKTEALSTVVRTSRKLDINLASP